MKQLFLALLLALSAWAGSPPALEWYPWSDEVFARAKREDRFVLLDLEAVWCHWCHVMDATTYQDPAAVALLKSKYIVVRVDQDSRPDLAGRYEDYGWPATIVFDREGHEIVKRQGYIAPKEMVSMVSACTRTHWYPAFSIHIFPRIFESAAPARVLAWYPGFGSPETTQTSWPSIVSLPSR